MAFIRNHVLPWLIACIYWAWSRTWRFQVIEDPAFKEAIKKGPVAFAHWHGDNLVVLRLGPHYHVASMASMSSDGELITRVLKIFGFGVARGSSHRSGVKALVGMIQRIKEGYNPAIAIDGPKGPPYKAKPGIIYLSQQASLPLIPTGVARSSALVFNRAWDKTYIPWPFSKVVVRFGAPWVPQNGDSNTDVSALENLLILERERATKELVQ